MEPVVLFASAASARQSRQRLAVGGCLAACLLLSALGCAGAPPADSPTLTVIASPSAQPSTTPLPATAVHLTAVPAPSQTLATTLTAVTTPGSVLGLQQELALADQEMNAAHSGTSLLEAQQHAQAAINTLVGAWGRWYDVNGFDDPSDRRGVFPGERVPGPANGTSTDLTPFGWGIRAYDQLTPSARPVIEKIMGNVKQWRDNPRARYDDIERALAGTPPNTSLINRLDGRAMRALGWARLIVSQASNLDQAQRYALAGSQETAAALAAVQTLP